MRQNPAFSDDYVADAYTVVAKIISDGNQVISGGPEQVRTTVFDWFPGMAMEAIEYVLYDGVAVPEDFDYATEKVEG